MALAENIKSNGSLPGIQIACRYFPDTANRAWVGDKAAILQKYQYFLKNLDIKQIDYVMDSFVRAASASIDSGFEVIQLHAAHGYFLSLLISPEVNQRKDKYGFSNLGGILDLLRKTRELSQTAIIDMRISCLNDISLSFDDEWVSNKKTISKIINSGLIDIVSLSAGFYDFSKSLIYPNKKSGDSPYLCYATDLASEFPDVLINTAGNIRIISDELPFIKNLTYSIGRPLLADPKFIEKSLTNKVNEIRHCEYSGYCHYFTRGQDNISCRVNDDI